MERLLIIVLFLLSGTQMDASWIDAPEIIAIRHFQFLRFIRSAKHVPEEAHGSGRMLNR
jgi:hypothetical protein